MPEMLIGFFAELTPAGAVCLSVGGYAALSIPVLLFPGTERADFDPRPALETTANRGIALAELHALQVRDRARLAAVALLLVAATHLDFTSAPKKGAL